MFEITKSLEFTQTPDPYRLDTGGRSVTVGYLWIDSDKEKIKVIVEQDYPGQTGRDPDMMRAILLTLPDPQPAPQPFEALIDTPLAQELLQRIGQGYSQEWSGKQPGEGWLMGDLDNDAQLALSELNAEIAELPPDERGFWTMEEWVSSINLAEITGEEVDEIIESPADDPNIVIIDDPAKSLLGIVAEKILYELGGKWAESDLHLLRGFAVLTRRTKNRIERVLELVTPAGHRWYLGWVK